MALFRPIPALFIAASFALLAGSLQAAEGSRWLRDTRFDLKTLKNRVDVINAEGGAITFDVPIAPDGAIPESVLGTLRELGKDVDKLTDGARTYR